MLRIRKLADRSGIIDPDVPPPMPLPLQGVRILGEPPAMCRVPSAWVQRGVSEGWIELDNTRVVHRPGGPTDDQWRVTHTFTHATAVTIKTLDGDVRYRVTHQPDKYVDGGADDDPVTADEYAAGNTRVDWFYDLELEA